MCTVVTRRAAGRPLRILAIRDEFATREFDDPGHWWPEHGDAVGGRDRVAGGTWCASDVASGVTALVLNRPERRHGTPSRGVLPLAALEHGGTWPAHVDHRGMAAFTLVLAGPDGVTAWSWDATELVRHDLADGLHVFTSAGVDAPTAKTTRLHAQLDDQPWSEVVTAEPPRDDPDALIVRHEVDGAVYATVFGQTITVPEPGVLELTYSRTPWLRDGWTARTLTAGR